MKAGNSSAQDLVFWQNNIMNLVVLATGIADTTIPGGGLTKAGPGTLVLDGSSTYTGPTSIQGGTLEIPFAAALGALSASSTLGPVILNGGSLVTTNFVPFDSGSPSPVPRNIVVGVNGGNLTAIGGTTLTINGSITDSTTGGGNLSFGNPGFINTAAANNSNATIGFGTNLGVGAIVLNGSNTYSGGTTVNAGTLLIGAAGALPDAPVTVASGASLQLSPGIGTVTVSSLTISGGTFDITQNNQLAVTYAGSATDPLATLRGYLKSARNNGVWNGSGLTSSVVKAEVDNAIAHGGGVYGIGYADGSRDAGQTIATGNQLLFEPALMGDANLNGSVTFIDLGIVAQNLGATNADWMHGDFNYDGTVNFLDIGLLAQNLSATILNMPIDSLVPNASPALTADWNLALAEIGANALQPANLPEPAVTGLAAVAVAGLLGRRRRR